MYAMNEIENWEKRSIKDRLRTKHRDVIEQIIEAKNNIWGEVLLLHVYSHQDKLDPNSPQDATRIAKIEREKQELDNPHLYELMVNGNDIADALAGIATKQKTLKFDKKKQATKGPSRRLRDWDSNPTFGTDSIDITHEVKTREGYARRWVDGKIHTWTRELTQHNIIETETKKAKKKNKPGKRGQYLLCLDPIDKRRSFDSGDRKKHQRHAESTTLFKIRTHSYNTVEKQHRRGLQGNNTKLRACFREAYPNKACPAHAEQIKAKLQETLRAQGIDVEDADLFETGVDPEPPTEDTEHILSCNARQSQTDTAIETWTKIYQIIRAKQPFGAPDARMLKPFGLRHDSIPTTPPPLPPPLAAGGRRGGNHSPDRYRAVRQVNAFPDNAAMLGLVPKGLVGALKELGVPHKEADQLADEVSQLVQSALVRELWLRSRNVAIHREWAALYGKHVLGKQLRSHD